MIEALRLFLELNRDLIFFIYGLSFFVLGLSIALQSRVRSRLDLARSVSWLAAFGFTHAFHEWGEYFIPIQSAYLSDGAVEVLQGLRLLLLAVSFACLLEFGARLLRPQSAARRLTLLNAALLIVWLFVTFVPLRAAYQGQTWHHLGDALARYGLGFPGALLAGYALRRHSIERIAPLNAPNIVRSLRIVGLSLVAYSLLGGLIPPAVPFFPGSVINSQSFAQVFVFPPMVFRSLLGLLMAWFTIRALEIFDLELDRRLEEMEQTQILQAEHSRIARELHDGAIQKVYTAGLLVESLSGHLQETEIAQSRLDRAVGALNDAIQDLRRNLRDLSPNPPVEPLASRLRNLSQDPRFRSFLDIELQVDLPPDPDMDPLRVEHVISIVSEALSNAVRHAEANRVKVLARRRGGQIQITVEDDGVGLPDEYSSGFGIRNMRDRARLLDGQLQLERTQKGGTRVELRAPVQVES